MCNVTIATATGVVAPSQINPSQIQVTGTLTQCASNNVVITVMDSAGNVVAGPSAPTPVDPVTGSYGVFLNIAGVACGAALTVTAECDKNPQCQTSFAVPALSCCHFGAILIEATVPPGALDPTALAVSGTAFGCPGSQVIVTVADNTGTFIAGPTTTAVDPLGNYGVLLSLTGTVHCDDTVFVTVSCSQNSSCNIKHRPSRVDCPQCARAQVSYTAGPCSGTPATQPTTISAIISVPQGKVVCFRWDYGDGTHGQQF